MKDKNVELSIDIAKKMLDVFQKNIKGLDCETAVDVVFSAMHLVVVNVVHNATNGNIENKIRVIKEVYKKLSDDTGINVN